MRALLALPRLHERALEGDLQRHHGVDLRDRWRRDERGVRRLTLRRLAVLVHSLPPDSLTARAVGWDGFTTTDVLLMDLWAVQTGKAHPARPKPSATRVQDAERAEKVRAAKRRAAQRRQAIAAGEII